MADLQQMSRVLYHHDWVNVEDWARNIAELADLSDDEIRQLETCPSCAATGGWRAGDDATAQLPSVRPSLTERTRHCLTVICTTFRLPLRRAC